MMKDQGKFWNWEKSLKDQQQKSLGEKRIVIVLPGLLCLLHIDSLLTEMCIAQCTYKLTNTVSTPIILHLAFEDTNREPNTDKG
jgi:hypothetical protein